METVETTDLAPRAKRFRDAPEPGPTCRRDECRAVGVTERGGPLHVSWD